jgi:hypothetical protein
MVRVRSNECEAREIVLTQSRNCKDESFTKESVDGHCFRQENSPWLVRRKGTIALKPILEMWVAANENIVSIPSRFAVTSIQPMACTADTQVIEHHVSLIE